MQKQSERAVRALSLAAVVIATAVLPLTAVETKFWQQDSLTDFEKGNLEGVSVRSDGRLSLAPVVTEILDSSTPYLWAVAQDSKGNLYAGGGGPTGSTAKLFQIDRNGKSSVLAEIEGLEIHAIAVDARDRVYAATAPDGKVYRVVNGRPEVFYDPNAKYIWAMAFSKKGDLYLGTGDRGDVHRVTPDGRGSVFFKTEDTHARSLAIDAQDNVIVGTEPSGVIVRISPAGEGFVLYQTPKREITALGIAKDGSVYAAAIGNKPSGPALTPPPAPAGPQPQPSATPGGAGPAQQQGRAAPLAAPPPMFGAAAAQSVAGGSEVYRITPDGAPRRVWNHAQDIAYALAIDEQGRVLIGTGNKGNVYRLESDLVYTLVVNLAPTQVTTFSRGANGQLFAATGNIGKVYRIGPELQKSGSYESEPFDANGFTYWGRLSFSGETAGGNVRFDARSGNVNQPQKNWSAWGPVTLEGDGGRVTAPAARFIQYRATLTAGPNGKSPELASVVVAHMSKNVAPVIQEVEVTPANYRFPGSLVSASATPPTLTLPPMGPRRRTLTPPQEITPGQTMQFAKGSVGARWLAQDENSDTLSFRVEIRGVDEAEWKLLREGLRERQFSWDSTSFADGRYVLRVIASDSPSNPPAEALTSQIVSDPFVIDNTAPLISGLAGSASGKQIEVRWRARDALSVIERAEYSVNGGEWTVVQPVTRLSDAPELEYRLVVERPQAGEYTIAVRVVDEFANQSVDKVVVK
jgi:hypothetical protein